MADVRQISAAIVVAIICKRRKRERKAKEVWEREWLSRRKERGLKTGELQEILTDGHENISGEVVNGFPYLINKYGTRFGAVSFNCGSRFQ